MLPVLALASTFQPQSRNFRRRAPAIRCAAAAVPLAAADSRSDIYTEDWDQLLRREYRETAEQLRERRAKWSPARLAASGQAIFGATAAPDAELFGEKIVRIEKPGKIRLADKFSRGDVLVLRPDSRSSERVVLRECCVVDVGKDWLTVGVGKSWPDGLWEARRRPGSFGVQLERAAPQAPLRAQQAALELARHGGAGDAAALLASENASIPEFATELPPHLAHGTADAAAVAIRTAVENARQGTAPFVPNDSQIEAVAWALGQRLSLIRGPPGTGKTRSAALLIASAQRLRGWSSDGAAAAAPPRVLAVAHSNGAADVLLQALLRMGVPAVRAGRPAAVAPSVRHRTVTALAEQHPEVRELRAQARNASLAPHARSAASWQLRQRHEEVCQLMLGGAGVVVASCVGAHQLVEAGAADFPLVVLDEGSQATEPALVTALAAARASQLVIVGDTRQLPPTVTSADAGLRRSLGRSPMARLEELGVAQRTLNVQYRMPPALLEHPSRHFYDSLVRCADDAPAPRPPPSGFPWRSGLPLCFVHCGGGDLDLEVSHPWGGKSNPDEAQLVARIVSGILEAGDVRRFNVAVIAPYSCQVDRVRRALAGACRVGTVDSFQGQETDLVVFTATRSNELGDLGFVLDPRRLCVAITRARRGLILVGDARTLRSSHHWAALIDSCQARGCYVDSEELYSS